jgi:hypothetical protein
LKNNKANKVKKARPGSKGSNHWNYQGRNETLAAKQERSERSLRLHYLAQIGREFGFMGGKNIAGRKPAGFMKLNMKNPDELVIALKVIEED